MTWTWHNPDRTPTPAELAAWADGELGPTEARQVEAWLADHPEAVDDAEALRRVVGLFRDHAIEGPSPDAWQATLAGIQAGLTTPAGALKQPRSPKPPTWRLRLILGLTAAAAVLGGVVVAGLKWPRATTPEVVKVGIEWPPGDDNDEPFAVVNASDINIISMQADDADRLVMDQPLLGTVEFVASEDIEVVKVMPDPEEGNMSRLQKGPMVPMIVLARVQDEEP
jgi:anti-sigma factor RsiW